MGVTVSKSKYGDPRKAVKNASKRTNLEIAVQIASQAKALAPVDQGQLRNSISASTLRENVLLNDSQGNEAIPLETRGLREGEAYVGSNTDHTIFQEYGTVKQPAQPFLRPSAELVLSKKPVEKIMSDYSRESMEAEFRKR